MSTELTTTNGNGGGIAGLRSALLPASFEQVLRFADMVAQSAFVPQAFRGKPGEIIAAVTYGAELGLSPMQALQTVAVINGKPAVYGDGMLAVCQSHPQWAGKEEYLEGEGDQMTAHCIVRRKGEPDVHAKFSTADAKAAGLLGKAGPWTQYKSRMLQMRARGFGLRDQYSDALKGIISTEEAQDYPPVGPNRARDITPPRGPIADPAETETAIEVQSIYGVVENVMPSDLDGWLADQVAEPVDDGTLAEWGAANSIRAVPGIGDAIEAEMRRRKAKAAKPNGNGTSNPEVKRLYKAAKDAFAANDHGAAVRARVEAFAILQDEPDEKAEGAFNDLFAKNTNPVAASEQPELV